MLRIAAARYGSLVACAKLAESALIMSGYDHHACPTCGAKHTPGLAACAYCKTAYPGIARGVKCLRCSALNAARQRECAHCHGDMTRACRVCEHLSPPDLAACGHCHHPFEHANQATQAKGGAKEGSRSGATMANDPCGVMSSLDDILGS